MDSLKPLATPLLPETPKANENKTNPFDVFKKENMRDLKQRICRVKK